MIAHTEARINIWRRAQGYFARRGGPVHHRTGERGLGEVLRLTRLWLIRRGLAMIRN